MKPDVKPWSNGPASSGKLNLRRDLRWVAKRTGKFPRKCTKVAKKNHFKATGSVPRGENVTRRKQTKWRLLSTGKGERLLVWFLFYYPCGVSVVVML